MSLAVGPFSLDRVENAVANVRRRLLKAAGALGAANVPYAVAGGNAVALWVSRVDESAVRNTRDVDVLIRRGDFEAARKALEGAGFVYRHVSGLDLFLDGPESKPRDAVKLVADSVVDESEDAGEYRVVGLEALVRIKLTAFRDKDRMHLRDLIEVGLVDEAWLSRLQEPLAERLQQLLQTPEG
jgi:hypothetical protein